MERKLLCKKTCWLMYCIQVFTGVEIGGEGLSPPHSKTILLNHASDPIFKDKPFTCPICEISSLSMKKILVTQCSSKNTQKFQQIASKDAQLFKTFSKGKDPFSKTHFQYGGLRHSPS